MIKGITKLFHHVSPSSVAGYVVAPGAFDVGTFLATSVGTSLTIASAHALNQWWETPHDAKMRRTKDRVLVTGQLTMQQGFNFGIATGILR